MPVVRMVITREIEFSYDAEHEEFNNTYEGDIEEIGYDLQNYGRSSFAVESGLAVLISDEEVDYEFIEQ